MPEFFQTVMGKRFFESTAPRIASALERIADALEEMKCSPQVCEDNKLNNEVNHD